MVARVDVIARPPGGSGPPPALVTRSIYSNHTRCDTTQLGNARASRDLFDENNRAKGLRDKERQRVRNSMRERDNGERRVKRKC